MSDVIISGYYGLGNSGDEALLKSIVDDLKRVNPDITITALSGNAQLTKKNYGIKTIGRFNIFSIIKEFYSAKLLISGGGTLIQDATSTKSLLYYLAVISLAKKMGLKVMSYANGMGPLKEKNLKKVEKVMNKVDLITLRENVSMEEIKRCNITKPEILVTADPAFNLVAASKERADEILSKYSAERDDRLIAVSVRKSKNNPEDFEEKMAKALDAVAENGYIPILIPMQKSVDLSISLDIAAKMKEQSRVIDRDLTVAEMLAVIGRCDIACGMRLHMLIFASVMNVPMVGIAYDPKIKGFMEYMKQERYIELENFDDEEFGKMLNDAIVNMDELKSQLEKDSEPLREKAKQNALLALKLLEN